MTPVSDPVAELEKILRYSFADRSRLQLALTHSSLKQSRNDLSYERLEFLRVLRHYGIEPVSDTNDVLRPAAAAMLSEGKDE